MKTRSKTTKTAKVAAVSLDDFGVDPSKTDPSKSSISGAKLPKNFRKAVKKSWTLQQIRKRSYSRQNDKTPSGWDFSLMLNYLRLVPNAFDSQLIAAASYYRLKHNPHDKKVCRDDYWNRTVKKVREAVDTPINGDSEPFEPPKHWAMLDVTNLKKWICKPLESIIEGIVARGTLTLVAGATQDRKTLFMLYLCLWMLQGGKLFGKFNIKPVKNLLYLCLEDPDRRIKDRLLDMTHEFASLPDPGRFIVHIAPGFKLNDDRVFQYLADLISDEGFEVIVIDTYQKATPGISSFSDEEQSLILHRLSDVTRKHNAAVVVLDHVRKTQGKQTRRALTIDDIKGTGGKAQNADCVILIERNKADQLVFRSFSKDWDTPISFLLDVSPQGSRGAKFTFAGDLSDLSTVSKGRSQANQLKVLLAMKPGKRHTNGELAKTVGLSESTVRRHLKTLIDEGKVEHNGKTGRWRTYQLTNQSSP